MAMTIPVSEVPRVSSIGLPTPMERTNYSPDEFGASAFGQAAEAAGKQLERLNAIRQDEKKKADATMVQARLNEVNVANQADLTFLSQAKGELAGPAAEEVYKAADKRAKDAWAALPNDDQKALFTEHADAALGQMRIIGERHVSEQISAVRKQAFDGANQTDLAYAREYAHIPEVAVEVAKSISQRIATFGQMSGAAPEAIEADRAAAVSGVYVEQIRSLMARDGGIEMAERVLKEHDPEIGKEGDDLRKAVALQSRSARADSLAKATAAKHLTANGLMDFAAAKEDVESTVPAGPDRAATLEALRQREADLKVGFAVRAANAWDKLLGDYHASGRSEVATRTMGSWVAPGVTPDMRERIHDMAEADARKSEGRPVSLAQRDAFNDLAIEMATKDDLWGTRSASELSRDPRYSVQPDHLRAQLGLKLAELHRDRSNPETIMKSVDGQVLAAAQASPILSKATRGKPYATWDDEDRHAYSQLKDRLAPLVLGWREDPANKGKRLSGEQIQSWVANLTRTGRIKNAWWRFDDETTEESALRRPEAEQQTRPFVPDIGQSEDAVGRDVQLRRGWDPEQHPNEFLPAALMKAARERAAVASGPSPTERLSIENRIRAKNRVPTPDAVQRIYEADVLGYTR